MSIIEFENGSVINPLTSSNCERSSRIKNMFPSFPNYTEEMYEGNEPSGSWEMTIGKTMYRWKTQWGDGQSTDEGIFEAKFQINQKITIYIVGSSLLIVDIRYAGKPDIYEYSNDDKLHYPSKGFVNKLEPDRIEKILNTKIPNCKFWDLVQARAKELCGGHYE